MQAVIQPAELALGIYAQLAGKLVGGLNVVPVKNGRIQCHKVQRTVTADAGHTVPIVQASTDMQFAGLYGIFRPRIVYVQLRPFTALTTSARARTQSACTATVRKALVVDAPMDPRQKVA